MPKCKFFKAVIKKLMGGLGYEIRKIPVGFADAESLGKSELFIERFREIVSDPLNILIKREPAAGYVDKRNHVVLHNGNRVPFTGKLAYYNEFSDILIINRGVHEPLEEFCFQEVLRKITIPNPVMVEMGAYWAHYSMWLKKKFPAARCIMVEPDPLNIECGKYNFLQNGYDGEFINKKISQDDLGIDAFMEEKGIARLEILHSDIQGFEIEMLQGAANTLQRKAVNYIFVSTHSEDIHSKALEILSGHSYRIEVSSPWQTHTTSSDGFILAGSPDIAPVFKNFSPLGRLDIARAEPLDLVKSITL